MRIMFILQHRLPLSIILLMGNTNGHCRITVLTICFIGWKTYFEFAKFLKVLFRFRFFTICGVVTFLGWKLLLIVYPQYNDLLNGFTYNGHAYYCCFCTFKLQLVSVISCFLRNNEPLYCTIFMDRYQRYHSP
jgi:hypothetical protein